MNRYFFFYEEYIVLFHAFGFVTHVSAKCYTPKPCKSPTIRMPPSFPRSGLEPCHQVSNGHKSKHTFSDPPRAAQLVLDPARNATTTGNEHGTRVHNVTPLVRKCERRRRRVDEHQDRWQRVEM